MISFGATSIQFKSLLLRENTAPVNRHVELVSHIYASLALLLLGLFCINELSKCCNVVREGLVEDVPLEPFDHFNAVTDDSRE